MQVIHAQEPGASLSISPPVLQSPKRRKHGHQELSHLPPSAAEEARNSWSPPEQSSVLNMPPVLTSGALRGSERAVMTSSSLPVTPPTTATGVALHQGGVLRVLSAIHVLLDGTGGQSMPSRHDHGMLAFCQAIPSAATGCGSQVPSPWAHCCAGSRHKLALQSDQVRPSAVCACSLVEGLAVAGAGADEEQVVQQVALEDLLVQVQCILQHCDRCEG